MSKTVTAYLDTASLTKAIRELEKYRDKELPDKIEAFMSKVATTLQMTADQTYNKYVKSKLTGLPWFDTWRVYVVLTRVSKNIWEVEANGREVCFIEFGTGVYATAQDLDHEQMAANIGVWVWPGSWSDEHGRTWNEWIASGKDPRKYPYNLQPRPGMYKGIQAAERIIENAVRRGLRND